MKYSGFHLAPLNLVKRLRASRRYTEFEIANPKSEGCTKGLGHNEHLRIVAGSYARKRASAKT